MPGHGQRQVAFLAGVDVWKQFWPGDEKGMVISQQQSAAAGDITNCGVDFRVDPGP